MAGLNRKTTCIVGLSALLGAVACAAEAGDGVAAAPPVGGGQPAGATTLGAVAPGGGTTTDPNSSMFAAGTATNTAGVGAAGATSTVNAVNPNAANAANPVNTAAGTAAADTTTPAATGVTDTSMAAAMPATATDTGTAALPTPNSGAATTTPAADTTTPAADTTTPAADTTTPAADPEPTASDPEPTASTSDVTVIPMLETGWVAATSNAFSMVGPWYCYDDGEVATSCVEDEPPFVGGEMCLSGSTIVDEDYAAWGAGIAFDLNDGSAFDADGAGVSSFKFTVSGSLGGLPLMVQMPLSTGDGQAPEFQIDSTGDYNIAISDFEIPEWHDDAGDGPNADKLYSIKFQIKGADAEGDYDFCISDLEPN